MRKNDSTKNIITNISSSILTRSKLRDNMCLIADFEPRIVKVALENAD